MSLEYKTAAYFRKAIRRAKLEPLRQNSWLAALPEFGLEAAGPSRDDAEDNLYEKLVKHVLAAQASGARLPVIEGIDLSPRNEQPDITEEQIIALDGLADYALDEAAAGRSISLEDFARDNNIALHAR